MSMHSGDERLLVLEPGLASSDLSRLGSHHSGTETGSGEGLGATVTNQASVEPAVSSAAPSLDAGLVQLAPRAARPELEREAALAGMLWIAVDAPLATDRGRLALVIEAAIEAQLQAGGAASAGFGSATNLDATLSDQLYRARTLGAGGFTLSFDTLARITNLAGAMDAEDSAILRWWLTAARERPVRLIFDARDRYLGVYTRPVPLESLLGAAEAVAVDAVAVDAVVAEAATLEPAASANAAPSEVSGETELAQAELPVPVPALDAEPSYSLSDLERDLRESSEIEPTPRSSRASVPPPPPLRARTRPPQADPEPSRTTAARSLAEAELAPQLTSASILQLGAVDSPEPAPVQFSAELRRDDLEPAPRGEARQLAFRSVLAALEALESEDLDESPLAPESAHVSEASDESLPSAAQHELDAQAQLNAQAEAAEPDAQVELNEQAEAVELDAQLELSAQLDPQPELTAQLELSAQLDPQPELTAQQELSAQSQALDPGGPQHTVDAAETLSYRAEVYEPEPSPLSDGFAALLTAEDQTPLPARPTPRLEYFEDALDRSSRAPQAELTAEAPEAEVAAGSETVVEAPVALRPAFRELELEPTAPVRSRLAVEADTESATNEAGEPDLPVEPAAPQIPEATWRGWVRDLEAARGPKPLAVVERLFTTAYAPLLEASLGQHLDDDAEDALSSWSAAFAKSYSDAFDALRIRGKRPTMVLDVPDIALRHGRMHGARQAQLLLVDGMRFDIGRMVHEHLKELAGRDAACVERLLLWSALPATTATQLELLGRGPQGLREPISGERDVPVARGRAASTLRRVKAGHRDVMKLDLVESRISEPGGTRPRALAALAQEVSEVLWAHMSGLPPRTLVVIFGDHGFCVDPESGTASHGGRSPSLATPEEVLVPAFAWLTGSVH